MDVLLPPLGNRPSPLQPQKPVKPERKTHIEPYEAEEDPDFSYDGFQVTRREYYAHMQEPAISFADGKLSGPVVATKNGSDILSDGIVEGSVQISANGQPILMLADHQTTGGYAKIATVIAPDLSAAAQLRPGEPAAFRPITVQQAVRLCRETAQQLRHIKELIDHD